MDDLSDDERERIKAGERLMEYETAVTLRLAEQILRHEKEFTSAVKALDGTAPDVLEKYYGVFNSIWTAKRALGESNC